MKGDFFDWEWRYSCALMSAPRALPAVGDWDHTLPYRHTMPCSSPVYTLPYYAQWVLPLKSCHAILQSRLYTAIWYPVSAHCCHFCTLPYHDNHCKALCLSEVTPCGCVETLLYQIHFTSFEPTLLFTYYATISCTCYSVDNWAIGQFGAGWRRKLRGFWPFRASFRQLRAIPIESKGRQHPSKTSKLSLPS